MTFERALALMRKGYKVKIKDRETYFYLDGEEIKSRYIKNTSLCAVDSAVIGWFEVMSDEWEVYNG